MPAEIKIDKFFGGLSDTSTRLGIGQTPFAENIDFRRDPEYIQLSRNYENKFQTGNSLMLCALDEKKYQHSFFAWENGEIYADNGNLVYTLSWWQDIINAIKFTDKYFFFYESGGLGYIMSIDVVNANNVAWAVWDVTEDYWIYTWGHYESHWYMLVINDSDDFLYITMGHNVIRLDQSSVITEWITLEDSITGFTRHWWTYRLYTRDWMLYAWDWFSLQHDWFTHLNTYVRYVYNSSGIDYIVWWTNWTYTTLYYAQWFWKEILKKAVMIKDKDLYRYGIANNGGNYTMSEFNWIMYITDINNGRIESFWKEYIWYPISYSIDQVITDCNNIWLIYRENRSPFLYFSYSDINWNYYIAWIQQGIAHWYTYMSEWMRYSQKYSFDHVQKKEWMEINARCDIPNNTTVTMEYCLDWWPRITIPSFVHWRSRLLAENINDYFFEIQFRFLLTTTDETISPKLYDCTLKFKEVEGE